MKLAKEVKRYGNWNRQVVQQREGIRVHHAVRGREGSVRPLQRDSGRRLQVAARGRAGRVRGPGGREGPPGSERDARRVGRSLMEVASQASYCSPPHAPFDQEVCDGGQKSANSSE